MSSARIQREIQALSRGELDLTTLIGRLKNLLVEPDAVPADLLREIEAAHRDAEITSDEYRQLTEFISENASRVAVPAAGFSDETAPVGDTVFVQASESGPETSDPSETRLLEQKPDPVPARSGERGINVGRRLSDRFILDEVLGVGGMGTVYKGRDALKVEAQDRNPFVAVKVLNDSFSQRPEAFIALQREASRQQRLAHPNIATVYDFYRDGGIMFITMEFLDGHTLDNLIREKARPQNGLPLSEALPIIEDLCAALSYAHARNIVHADFKPGNCFLTSNNHVKVLDFGIARATKDPNAAPGDETLFDPRSIGALTPAYASPEMLSDSAEPDPRDDIYALACVCYELLSGRHPFHRVPGDQAKSSELKPAKIAGLSRRQNAALVRGLAFERDERTSSVDVFLRELKQESTTSNVAWRAGGLALIGVVVVALLSAIPTYLENREVASLVDDLNSVDPNRIDRALAELKEFEPDSRSKVLLESRSALIDYFRNTFNAMMNADDASVSFPAVQALLDTSTGLYPDSAALAELSGIFTQRRDAYLSSLAGQFETYLERDRLLPSEETDDLYDLLDRLRAVDGDNRLLTDDRIQAAYASATEDELEAGNYDAARQYLNAGTALVADDPLLSDLQDRLNVIEQQQALARAIANLKTELEQAQAAVTDLPGVLTVVPALEGLEELEPDAAEIPATGVALRERLAGELDRVLQADTLPEVDDFLSRYSEVWQQLGQDEVPAGVQARRGELVAEQDRLEANVRAALDSPDMVAGGMPATALISNLRSIDPADPRPDRLLEELVAERERRAQVALAEQNWDGAREELNAALAVGLPAALASRVNEGLQNVDTTQSGYLAELEEQRRLEAARREEERQIAEAQREEERQIAEARREAERRELERRQTAEEAERARQTALARQAEIDQAATAVAAAVSAFPGRDPARAVREIQARLATLATLDPVHPAIAGTESALPGLVAGYVRDIADPQSALTTLASLVELTGENPELTSLRSELEAARRSELENQRLARIRETEASLSAALADPAALERTETRRQADAALRDLEGLAPGDTALLNRARERYVAAFVAAAAALIEVKRFSLAEELIGSASDRIPNDRQVAEVQRDLETARASYREERSEQQRLARLSAQRQQFQLSVSSGELAQAGQTLDELKRIDGASDFVRSVAPAALAQAYRDRAASALDRADFDAARQAVASGRPYAEDPAPFDALVRSIDRGELERGLSDWFAGGSNRSTAAVSADLTRFRTLARDGFDTVRGRWEQMTVTRLDALKASPDAYNALLSEVQGLLPDSARLSRLQPLATLPTLAIEDLLGRWCGEQMQMELTAQRLRFDLGNRQQVAYDVKSYDVRDEQIVVHWQQDRNQEVVFEFGNFSAAKDQMVQLRGRAVGSNSWQTYNRPFRRCQ